MLSFIVEVFVLLFRILGTYVEATCRLFCPCVFRRKSLRNEVVLITGSGHGIGKCLSMLFAEQGAKVVMWDINKSMNEAAAREVRMSAGEAFPYQCDVMSEEQVYHTAAKVKAEVGDVTILVNNAGILNGKSLLKVTSQQVRRCIDVNLVSHFWTLKAFLPGMVEKDHGHVVGISSIAGHFGTMNASDYVCSKFGVRGLMECVEDELKFNCKTKNILVTSVYPHWTDTGLAKNMHNRFPQLTPLTRTEGTARAVVDGVRTGARNVYVPRVRTGIIVGILAGILPSRGVKLLQYFSESYIDEF